MKIRGYMNVTLRVPFSSEIDIYEFQEWGEGADMDSEALSEFIYAHRDYPGNVDFAVANANIHEVVSYEIDQVLESR